MTCPSFSSAGMAHLTVVDIGAVAGLTPPWRKGPREQFCRGKGRYRQGAWQSPSLRGKSRGRPPVPPLRPAKYPRRRESSLGTRVRGAARFTVEKHTSSRSAPVDGPHDVCGPLRTVAWTKLSRGRAVSVSGPCMPGGPTGLVGPEAPVLKDRHFRIALPGGESVRQVMLFGPAAEPFTAETSVDGPADTTMDGPGHPRTAPPPWKPPGRTGPVAPRHRSRKAHAHRTGRHRPRPGPAARRWQRLLGGARPVAERGRNPEKRSAGPQRPGPQVGRGVPAPAVGQPGPRRTFTHES